MTAYLTPTEMENILGAWKTKRNIKHMSVYHNFYFLYMFCFSKVPLTINRPVANYYQITAELSYLL